MVKILMSLVALTGVAALSSDTRRTSLLENDGLPTMTEGEESSVAPPAQVKPYLSHTNIFSCRLV